MLVDGEARWEFQYLRNALLRDLRVKLDTVVFHQPSESGPAGMFYPSVLPAAPPPAPPADATKAPPVPDPLGAYDVIILGDLTDEDMPPEAWNRIERYVAERGGTLVLSSGPRAWPAVSTNQETVRKLLPVQDVRPVPVESAASDPERPALPGGLPLVPTTIGLTGPWPMLQFGEDAEQSRTAWTALPPLPWVLAGTPKPTATALAAAIPAKSAGEPALDQTALAALPYGLGKVLWVGTDSTWRWRSAWATRIIIVSGARSCSGPRAGKLAAGNRLVQFGPVPPRVADDQPAHLRPFRRHRGGRRSELARGRPGVQSPNGGFQIANSRFQIPDSRFQIPDSRFQSPTSGFQRPDAGFQRPEPRVRNLKSAIWNPESGSGIPGSESGIRHPWANPWRSYRFVPATISRARSKPRPRSCRRVNM